MKVAKAAVGAALAVTAMLGGGATALADTQGATAHAGPLVPHSALYTVTTWHDVNIRSCPASTCAQVGGLVAGQQRKVACWVHGESVTDAGVTNDIWLQVGHEVGNLQWASAVYFQGDQYGGIPADAQCAP
ncbi:SH3 domain-containing protein [Solihabitans fulvus]|uniref:SH3 domain-containing protein n=1 Tax=Solihabitans fulvus TaxID=1892852 RepID=A0A5B2XUA7_9PSEU|nr:SH3 domain-containing protein [Solihabitans fulvus]KAA2266512.1 SH3 domain-containing protein [Solihabitans fulvus]